MTEDLVNYHRPDERGGRMRILCDKCKKETVSFDARDKWVHIELSEKGYGKLGDYYLCPECSKDFYKFLEGGIVDDSK